MEAVRQHLRAIPQSSISYSEFIRICRKESEADEITAAIARSLEESGSVIAMGNLVFLRPSEMVRDIGRVIVPLPRANYERSVKELREMERQKAEIDKKAAAGVRRELWCGLGFLLFQTLGFFRLTFWELSWDVMEPVCFYVTSSYFMAGYSFFLKTSRDPSLEGFFEIRFAAKRGRLMRDSNFDLRRFDELKQKVSFFLLVMAHITRLIGLIGAVDVSESRSFIKWVWVWYRDKLSGGYGGYMDNLWMVN